MERKNFITVNQPFICENCAHKTPPHESSCRNHCTQCLYSKHVDSKTPGDRKSQCHSLMQPISLDYSKKKGNMIVHNCLKCHKKMRNKVADDDNQDSIINISTQHA